MKLEYLYPELGNLYGDGANMRYLRKCIPEAEYIETPLNAEPAFAGDGDVRFVYCGPMTERGQRMALPALRPRAGRTHRRRLLLPLYRKQHGAGRTEHPDG